jgi:hypothetical protein
MNRTHKHVYTSSFDRSKVKLTAMCFPTPRDSITDRARGLFDDHINISPEDKSLAHERILLAQADFILFADISYDSRVFALAHERYLYVRMYVYPNYM